MRINAKINHGANEHVTAQPAEDVQIESFHFASEASALIWLAA
jgi:hypothetical protein